jgi:hypothetical protein
LQPRQKADIVATRAQVGPVRLGNLRAGRRRLGAGGFLRLRRDNRNVPSHETGHPSARLAASFTLSRDGHPVFTKTLSVESTWDFQFFADIAIPDAFNHYAGLFPALVGKLLADPDFRAAARAS